MAKNERDAEKDDPHAEIEGYLSSEAWESRLAEARIRRETALAQRRAASGGEDRPSIRPSVAKAPAEEDVAPVADASGPGTLVAGARPPRRVRRANGIRAAILGGVAAIVLAAIAFAALRTSGSDVDTQSVSVTTAPLPQAASDAPDFPDAPEGGADAPAPGPSEGDASAMPGAPESPSETAPPEAARRLEPPPARPDRDAMAAPDAPDFAVAEDRPPTELPSWPGGTGDADEPAVPARPEASTASRPEEPDLPTMSPPRSLSDAASYRVTLHGQSSEARQSMQVELTEAGFAAIEVSETPFSWPATMVFYFHEADAAMAERLAERLQGTSRSVVGLSPSPAVGRLDVFLGD